jgi:hypothetical protein
MVAQFCLFWLYVLTTITDLWFDLASVKFLLSNQVELFFMSIFVPKNTYPSTNAQEYVSMEVKHVLNHLIWGQITYLKNKKQKKNSKYLDPSLHFPAHKISIIYLNLHLRQNFKKSHNTSKAPGIILFRPCFDLNLSGNTEMQPTV